MSAPSAVPSLPFDYGLLTVVWKPQTGAPISVQVGSENVKVAFDEEQITSHVAAEGTVTFAINNNRMGKITVTIPQNSPVHAFLSAQAAIDRATGQGYGPIAVEDGSGFSVHTAPVARLAKVADAEYQKEVSTREWTFICDQLTSNVAGLA